MVGPSFGDDERDRTARLLKVGFVLLVAASGALVALQAGGDRAVVAATFLGSLVVGAALTWFVARNLARIQPDGMRERQERTRKQRERERNRNR